MPKSQPKPSQTFFTSVNQASRGMLIQHTVNEHEHVSFWPFHPLVWGHLTLKKGHLTSLLSIQKGALSKLPGTNRTNHLWPVTSKNQLQVIFASPKKLDQSTWLCDPSDGRGGCPENPGRPPWPLKVDHFDTRITEKGEVPKYYLPF